jgi:hypothetical protein
LELGRELGYEVDNGWTHRERRFLIFLGDLVDRGQYSLEVAELVRGLVAERRALCIMGNHEYNLLAWNMRIPGYEEPKKSNRPTTQAIAANRDRWQPTLEFFRRLPIGIELPDLRLIHACWHRKSLDLVKPILGQEILRIAATVDDYEWVTAHAVLRSPFAEAGLVRASWRHKR